MRPRVQLRGWLVTTGCLICAFALGGCYSYRPFTPPPTIGGHVRARFAEPTDLPAVNPDGDTLTLLGVREVQGRVTAVRGDTLLVELMGDPRKVRAKVPTGRSLEKGHVSPGKTSL